MPRASCLPGKRFSGQAFHRLASRVSEEALETARINLARATGTEFKLLANVPALDTTNFDPFNMKGSGWQRYHRGVSAPGDVRLRVSR